MNETSFGYAQISPYLSKKLKERPFHIAHVLVNIYMAAEMVSSEDCCIIRVLVGSDNEMSAQNMTEALL